MKDACVGCKFEKPGNPHFCTKYGIPIWKQRTYCVSKEPEGGAKVVQVSGERTGEQIPFAEDRC